MSRRRRADRAIAGGGGDHPPRQGHGQDGALVALQQCLLELLDTRVKGEQPVELVGLGADGHLGVEDLEGHVGAAGGQQVPGHRQAGHVSSEPGEGGEEKRMRVGGGKGGGGGRGM